MEEDNNFLSLMKTLIASLEKYYNDIATNGGIDAYLQYFFNKLYSYMFINGMTVRIGCARRCCLHIKACG